MSFQQNKTLPAIVFVILLLPYAARAEEKGIIPALCRNVLASENGETPVPIKDILISEAKQIPKKVIAGVVSKGDVLAGKLDGNLESLKIDPAGKKKSQVLGISAKAEDPSIWARLRNGVIDGIQFLVEKWKWTVPAGGMGFLAWAFVF